MKILITGGAGYIGSELVNQLAKHQEVESLVIYDNLSRKNYNLFIANQILPSNVRFVHGDILDSRTLRKNLENVDTVIHCAAKVSTPFANEDSHQFEQVNHWGTAELCYAIEEFPIERLIFMSSTSVYGSHQENVNINSLPNPRTFYGISKLRGEQHVNRVAGMTNVFNVRCGNVYGFNTSMRFDAVINRFMFEANFKNRISIHGDGKQKRAFIHVHKVAMAIEKILFGNLQPGTFNLADINISILELTAVIKEIYPDLEFIFVDQHMQMRNLEVEMDDSMLQFELPHSNLEADLRDFAAHFSFHSPVTITR